MDLVSYDSIDSSEEYKLLVVYPRRSNVLLNNPFMVGRSIGNSMGSFLYFC